MMPRPIVRTWQQLGEGRPDAPDLAEDFHEASKCYRATVGRLIHSGRLDRDPDLAQASLEGCRDLPQLPAVPLEPIDPEAEQRAVPALVREHSCRSFDTRPVPIALFGRVLWLSYGRYPSDPAVPFRRRPIAAGGALYALELYAVADLHGSGKGVYHYNVREHSLEEVCAAVTDDDLRELGAEPDLLVTPPVILLITGLFARSRFKYGLRGYRFTLLEAGALIHQVQLVAQVLGLRSVPVAGLYDDAVEGLCGLDGVDESFINAVVLGYSKPPR